MRNAFLGTLLFSAIPLGGCVIAAVPIAAAGAIGASQAKAGQERPSQAERRGRRQQKAAMAIANDAGAPARTAETLSMPTRLDGDVRPPSDGAPAAAPTAAGELAATSAVDLVPPGMQYLYGSGEAAAASLQAYATLKDWILAKATARQIGQPVSSVVLALGSTLAAPRFTPCGDKPLAVVLDIDETSLLNLGFEDDARVAAGFDAAKWDAWERTGAGAVAAVPGVREAKAVADAAGVTFVFNSNRSEANASATVAALAAAGLGPVTLGDTLWLLSDPRTGGRKDTRRTAISATYCVIALVGDQLGDFSDQFNAVGATPAIRRNLVQATALKTIWGHGWFVLPNPVYGTALKGGRNEIFPADKRWTPNTQGAK